MYVCMYVCMYIHVYNLHLGLIKLLLIIKSRAPKINKRKKQIPDNPNSEK